jgi:hypothetical protein
MSILIAWLVSQGESGGTDLLYWILPAICLVLALAQPRGEKIPQQQMLVESWFTPQGIEEVYNTIIAEMDKWRLTEAKSRPPSSMVTRF